MNRSFLPATVVLAALTSGSLDPAAGGDMDPASDIIDFGAGDTSEWYVINDGVMGGMSGGDIRITDVGTGVFSGVLSLDNNGGFASVRAAVGHRDLSAYDGLEIRVRGDGRTYQLRLRTDDRFDGIAYRAAFETEAGIWVTVRRSFGEFEPTFRGRTPHDAEPLDPARIHQVGFMLADKQPGPFSLEIDAVRAFSTNADRP